MTGEYKGTRTEGTAYTALQNAEMALANRRDILYTEGVIKVVLIDIDNTVMDFDRCSKRSMKLTCEDWGIPFKDGMFDAFKSYNDRRWQEIERGELTVKRLFEVRWNEVFASLGIPMSDGPKFERDFHVYLNVSDIPEDGAKEALAYLSKKYRVFAASNSNTMKQALRLQKTGMLPYFEGLFLSEDMGATKPDRAFFDIIFSNLGGVTPEETVMIGDSLSADIAGAAAYGIRTVWYNKARLSYDSSCPPADFVIYDMRDVRNIL